MPTQISPDQYAGMNQLPAMGNLFGQFEITRQQAQQGNIERAAQIGAGYDQYATGYAQLAQQLLGQLGNIGQSQRSRLQQKFEKQGAGLTQDYINRGLYNATAMDAARRGLSRDQADQEMALEDTLTRQQLEYGARLGSEALGAMLPGLKFQESIDETGPSYEDLYKVAGLMGQGNAQVPPWLSGLDPSQIGPQGGTTLPTGPSLPGPSGPSGPTPQYPYPSQQTYGPFGPSLPDYGRPPGGLTSTGGFFNRGGGGGGGGGGRGGALDPGDWFGFDWDAWEEANWGPRDKPEETEQERPANKTTGTPQTTDRVLTQEETNKLRDFGDPDFDMGQGFVPALSGSGNLVGYWPKGVWDYISKQSGGNPMKAAQLEQQFKSYRQPVSAGQSSSGFNVGGIM